MKNLLFFLISLVFFSCTPTSEEEENIIPLEDTVVKFVFTTQEPNYDEVHFTYYDYKTDSSISEVHPFPYNNSGNPLPLVIELENYNFRYIDGEGYRNNHSTALLSVEVFVNDNLVVTDEARGDSNRFARVIFQYDIVAGK